MFKYRRVKDIREDVERMLMPSRIAEMESDLKVLAATRVVSITREEFDLLDSTQENTVYYIAEKDGTLTMKKGDNK